MKKIIFILAGMFSLSAYAQQGTILKYGDIGLDINNSQDNNTVGTAKSTNFHILPGFGYQFTKHLTAGLQGGYSSDKTVNTTPSYYYVNYPSYTNTTKDHSWGVGVFGRYTEYIGNVFFLITQLDLGYIGDKTTSSGTYPYAYPELNSTTTQNGFAANLFPGVGAFIHKGWALNFNIGGLGYAFTRGEDGAVKNSHFSFNMGRQANLGVSRNISYHMHKHHASPDDVHRRESNDDNSNDD